MKTIHSRQYITGLLHTATLLLYWFTLSSTISAQPFYDCDISDYYASTDINVREALHSLIQSTHRNILPYTSSAPDVWDALIDLDSNGNDQVSLIYASRNVPSQTFGTSDTWNREHLWPKSLGVGTTGPDFTDVHHLRPSDWNVNAARGNKWFGECGIVDVMEDCVTPAHEQAATDTSTDNIVWLPPAKVRGDIARALFYMDLRYDGDGVNEFDLVLVDCLTESETQMGYLSQLLKWHEEDPVDDVERARNARVCQSWQGNRNPFVDYPDLVASYFGAPREPDSPFGYKCNDDNSSGNTTSGSPSPSPTSPTVFSDGTCNGLQPGVIMVTAFNSNNPDVVVLVALKDIPTGATLYMTDNAWTGANFLTNEGTLKV